MIGTAAAITGLVFGIQAGLRGTPTSGPSAQPGQSISGATDAHNKEQGTAARLTDSFGAALSTEAPGATSTHWNRVSATTPIRDTPDSP